MTSDLKRLERPRVSLCGTSAVLFEAEGALSLETQERLWSLCETVRGWSGVSDLQPCMNNVLILVDPIIVDANVLAERLVKSWGQVRPLRREMRVLEIGVNYGGEWGMDMRSVADFHSLSVNEVAVLHSKAEYTVFAPGSAPGFGYLFGLDSRLFTPRKQVPVMRAADSYVSIGGAQASLGTPRQSRLPEMSPNGWHAIGYASEAPMPYDFSREQPFLLSPGDRIRFRIERIDQ